MKPEQPVTRAKDIPKCPRCHGAKHVERLVRKMNGRLGTVTEQCALCDGYGFVVPEKKK